MMHGMTLAASAGARLAGVHACFPGLACGREFEIVAIFTIVFLFNSSDTTKIK